MPRSARAILFDLDDTLYPLRRFIFSGFASVAKSLAAQYGIDAAAAYWMMRRAFTSAARGRELQMCLERHRLPLGALPSLLKLMRHHRPSLRLPPASRDVLASLRPEWRIGIVTNGVPAIQARKVEALGLPSLVDLIVFAAEHGSGAGKPEPHAFVFAAASLGAGRSRTVFVGDDERADVAGATGVGMRSIHLRARTSEGRVMSAADAVVRSLREVPSIAASLVDGANLVSRVGSRDAA